MICLIWKQPSMHLLLLTTVLGVVVAQTPKPHVVHASATSASTVPRFPLECQRIAQNALAGSTYPMGSTARVFGIWCPWVLKIEIRFVQSECKLPFRKQSSRDYHVEISEVCWCDNNTNIFVITHYRNETFNCCNLFQFCLVMGHQRRIVYRELLLLAYGTTVFSHAGEKIIQNYGINSYNKFILDLYIVVMIYDWFLTNKRSRKPKDQPRIDNPEKLATWHMPKTNKTKNTPQQKKTVIQYDPR
jgi:hypothetical protein